MITSKERDLAKVIYYRLQALYEETKEMGSNEYAQKNLLSEILMDVNELNAQLYKVWRDVR